MGLPKKVSKLFLLAHNTLSKNKYRVFLFGGIFFSWVLFGISFLTYFTKGVNRNSVLGLNTSAITKVADATLLSPVVQITLSPTILPTLTPTIPPTPVPTSKPKKIVTPTESISTAPSPSNPNPSQYTAEKIDDVTWKVSNVENDSEMATASEIINEINSYRAKNGRGRLETDNNLSSFAQDRANLFAGEGKLDSHAGFRSFMDNGGFDKAGFNSLGENSAYISGPMGSEKIVKSIFGADSSHDSNQLDNWTHTGVGVNGKAINVNFGKGKK